MATNVGTIELLATINTGQYNRDAKNLEKTNKDVGSSMDSVDKKSRGMSDSLRTAAKVGFGALATAAAGALALVVKNMDNAIKRVDTLNNADRVFENMGFAADATERAISALEKSIKGLPTPLDSAIRGVQTLSGTIGDVEKSQQVFTALNNAIIGFGGSAFEVEGAINQLSQLPMDGPLDAQTWNSLRNNGLTPVFNAIAKESGVSMGRLREQFSTGELTVADFTDRLIRMNKDGGGGLASLEQIARASTSGIATSFANMQTAITRGLAKIIEAVGASNIAGAITSIGVGFETVLTNIAGLVTALPGLRDQLVGFFEQNQTGIATLSVLIGSLLIPQIVNIGISSAISFGIYTKGLAIATAATVRSSAIMASGWLRALGPIGLIVSLLAGAGAAAVLNWDTVSAFISRAVDGVIGFVQQSVSFVQANFPKIIEAIVSTFRTVVQAMPGILQSILTFLVTSLPEFIRFGGEMVLFLIQGMISAIPGIVSALNSIIEEFGDFVAASLPGMVDAGVEVVVGLIDGIAKALPDIVKAASDILDTVITSVSENLPNILNAGIEIVTKLLEGIIAALPMIITATVGIISNILTAIVDNLPTIISAAVQLVTALVTGIISMLPTIISAVLQIVIQIGMALINNLPVIIDAVINLVLAMATALIGMLPAIVDATIKLVVALAGAIIQNLPKIIVAVVRLVIAITKALIQNLPLLIGAIFQIVVALGKALIKNIPVLLRAVGDIVGAIGSAFFRLFFVEAPKIGRQLIEGLWNGISNAAGWIGERIKGFGDGIMNTLKDFFGIHSPSRLMRDQVGKMLGLGIADGITSSGKVAVKAASDVSNRVMSAFGDMQSSYDIGVRSGSMDALDTASLSRMDDMISSRSSSQAPVNITVNASANMIRTETDKREFANMIVESFNQDRRAKSLPQIGTTQ